MHVWVDVLPVSVVQRTTTVWFFASPWPSSLDDNNWYALADAVNVNAINNDDISFFMTHHPLVISL